MPVVAARKILLWRASQDQAVLNRGFKPMSPRSNDLLILLMRLETFLLKHPPIGASIILLARKR